MNDKCVILGTAPDLEADLDDLAAISTGNGFDFIAVGLDCADRYLGRIEHAVSYHPKEFAAFRERRVKVGGNLDYMTHSHSDNGKPDRVWPYMAPSGSSAMLGVEVALGLGYRKIIVAGVSLYDKDYKRFQVGWKIRFDGRREDYTNELKLRTYPEGVINALRDQKDRVRAMSGYPREILGAPTGEWLNS